MADRHPIDRALDCLADYERAIKGDNYNVNPDYPADVRDELAQWWAYNGDIGAVNADGTFERMFQGAEEEEAMTEEKLHRAIARAVRADAEKKKNNAGYSGAHHDGGAAQLLGLLEAWQAGLQGRIPAAFSDYQAQHIRDTDQEYAQYLRLRRKFEGK